MAKKVLVVGSSSGVGLEVPKQLLALADKFDVYALVRNQERAAKAIGDGASNVKFINGDVTKSETLLPACQDMDAVVCTIGARTGWRLPGFNQQTPRYVDYVGVKHLAEAAFSAKVPTFVLVSSMFVTRPFSFVGLLLNTLFGRVLVWKLKGENALRDVYSKDGHLSYYVVRPGGLNNTEGGQYKIIAEKGDKGTGSISRRDVAAVVVACVDGLCTPNVTFEIYCDIQQLPLNGLKDILSLDPDNN